MAARKPLTSEDKKRLRGIGHDLKPIVTIGGNGVTEGVLAELDRALTDHELIKLKIAAGERDDRQPVIDYVTAETRCELVASIGKIALLYRRNPKADPKKSNVR
ncbi:ribosome assembly RNA-binding protein YhbY [Natronospirillum operosum]|uniref:Ribosome assembly RNA-binding protein YhbY n=1 Tax=Natronospirillum operosum TaxID=2759953 RepID=A0A4Z0W966_9GAMM|nr:ribosome assembly RNA-binding protein YhbY [Natronospirillum operosum]TGG94127.1 ribosome assembly RNA-binding protein YhbY [Natronospirillum operosum]